MPIHGPLAFLHPSIINRASSATFASLVVILVGALERIYIKHMVMNLGLNTWDFVNYNNLISLMIAPVVWLVTGKFQKILALLNPKKLVEGDSDSNTMITAVAFAASCFFGLSISFFGFAARKAISATAFTVTGVVNKLFTVKSNRRSQGGNKGADVSAVYVGNALIHMYGFSGRVETARQLFDGISERDVVS